MGAKLLDGAAMAAAIKEETAAEVGGVPAERARPGWGFVVVPSGLPSEIASVACRFHRLAIAAGRRDTLEAAAARQT